VLELPTRLGNPDQSLSSELAVVTVIAMQLVVIPTDATLTIAVRGCTLSANSTREASVPQVIPVIILLAVITSLMLRVLTTTSSTLLSALPLSAIASRLPCTAVEKS
jgi:hypothetical protein